MSEPAICWRCQAALVHGECPRCDVDVREGPSEPPCHECARMLLPTCDCEDAKTEWLRQRIAELERALLGHGMDKQKLQAEVARLDALAHTWQADYDAAAVTVGKLEARAQELKRELERAHAQWAKDVRAAQAVEQERDRLAAEVTTLREQVTTFQAEMERVKTSEDDVVGAWERDKAKVARLEGQLAMAREALESISRGGIPDGVHATAEEWMLAMAKTALAALDASTSSSCSETARTAQEQGAGKDGGD